MNAQLHIATPGKPLSLADALKVLGKEAVGLFYGPRECCFARVAAGQVTGPDNKTLDLAAFYEARVFNADAELRWWNDPVEGKHRTALVSEQASAPQDWKREEISVIGTECQSYLLWGQATGNSAPSGQWTILTTARIGKLDVPMTGGKQFVMKATEYFTEFDDGNVAVTEERLVQLAPYEPSDKENSDE